MDDLVEIVSEIALGLFRFCILSLLHPFLIQIANNHIPFNIDVPFLSLIYAVTARLPDHRPAIPGGRENLGIIRTRSMQMGIR